MTDYIKKFQIDSSLLTKEELAVLEKLAQAAELISNVYQAQLKDSFYPKGATRQEIEKAASTNSEILSPYTVVERDKEGNLVAIPYHIKYKSLLEPIAKKLSEAAQIPIPREDFRKALLVQSKALLEGKYDLAQITWMKVKPYILNIVIGPMERIEDNYFFVKRSYEAWVGVMDKDATERLNKLKDIVFQARRKVLASESVDFMKKAQLRADETIIFSGMIANYCYTATTLPNDIELLEKYGSEGWIFLPSIRENFEERNYNLFNKIFSPFFRDSFSKDDLVRGYLLLVTMHEIARIAIRYRFSVDRLQEYYPIFNEIAIEALAVKMCGTLLLKDVISQKEMESVLVIFITRMFDGYIEESEHNVGLKPLTSGNAILMNSLLEDGAIKVENDGISWPNFTKTFLSVSELANSLEKILAEGTYPDAEDYTKKHSSAGVFKKFTPAIKV